MANVNFSLKMETERFNIMVKKFVDSVAGNQTDIVIKKIAFDLLSSIISNKRGYKHPVDTGRARAGWYASVSGLGVDWVDEGIDTEAIAEGKASGSYRERLGFIPRGLKYVEMVNGVRYIIYLEYGHSKQAPYGMVRYNMRQMLGGRAVRERIDAVIAGTWNKHFD